MSDVKMTPKEQAYVDELTAILKRMPRNIYVETDFAPYLFVWKRADATSHLQVGRVRIRSGQ